MPPLEPDGTSLLWESLGRKFTGLDLPGGRSPVAGQQGVHPHAVSAGSALRVAAAGARAGADRPGRARDQGASRRCCARSGSPTRIASIRSTAGRTFTRAPTTSRWCARTRVGRVAAARRRAGRAGRVRGAAPRRARAGRSRRISWRRARSCRPRRPAARGARGRHRRRWRCAPTRATHCRSRPATRSRTFVSA